MYCQECGTKTSENAKFCSECGRKMPSTKDISDRPRRVYTVQTALREYFQGVIGETKLRDAIRQGQIPHTRVGTRILMREETLDKWMTEQEQLSVNKFSGRLRAIR